MSYTANKGIPATPNTSLPSTITSLLDPTAAVQSYTTAVQQVHASTSTHSDNQTTLNIIFGVFAIVLAFIAILIGWLQLRRFRQHRGTSDEEAALCWPQYELLEVK